jgi:hypothetical protein
MPGRMSPAAQIGGTTPFVWQLVFILAAGILFIYKINKWDYEVPQQLKI